MNGGIASGKFMAGGCDSDKDEPIDFDEITETDEEDDLKKAFAKPEGNGRRGRRAKPEE